MKKILDNGHIMHYNNHCSAGVAHLVERDLAKVEVASSSLVARSKKNTTHQGGVSFGQVGQRLERARAQREKHAGGMFWCPCACGGPAGPPVSLVARSKKTPPIRVVFLLVKSGRGSKGHERSEKNMPVACFGARVRVAARQGRQRASSPAPKKTPS